MDWRFLIKDKTSLCVTTDSRQVIPGCVFVALKGEHFDGNDFVEQSFEKGAEYVIHGPNALAELQDLARAWRRELNIPILGITGTNGKTTTKELCAAVLATKYNLYYTQGNLNNQLGVPLTLLSITRAHEMAVVEMGASHPGDIKELVEVAEPNYGLITNVGRAHLQGFGSFEGVMSTKAELYDWLLAHNGTIFRNADNPYLEKMFMTACKANGIDPKQSDSETVLYQTGKMPENTHLVGDYNAENVSAALCLGEYFGVNREKALETIRAYIPSNNRSQLMQTEHNTVVVDAYNANPTSMQAAINAFTACQNTKTENRKNVFILGSMKELGEYSHLEHQNIVNMLLERKEDTVFLVGDEYKETSAPYQIFSKITDLCDYIKTNPILNARILLKGSRGNKMEQIIPFL